MIVEAGADEASPASSASTTTSQATGSSSEGTTFSDSHGAHRRHRSSRQGRSRRHGDSSTDTSHDGTDGGAHRRARARRRRSAGSAGASAAQGAVTDALPAPSILQADASVQTIPANLPVLQRLQAEAEQLRKELSKLAGGSQAQTTTVINPSLVAVVLPRDPCITFALVAWRNGGR